MHRYPGSKSRGLETQETSSLARKLQICAGQQSVAHHVIALLFRPICFNISEEVFV
jgi:hypothetical protein